MDGFDALPIMQKHLEFDKLTPQEALIELEDDRVCSRCGRNMAKVEQATLALDSFDFYLKAMDDRRERRANYLEKMTAKVDSDFFNVARKTHDHAPPVLASARRPK